ncbi:hypothetical protein MMC25_001637 [Agyrium rufum]|nr:hypothetical protein [Agyrium rufum]
MHYLHQYHLIAWSWVVRIFAYKEPPIVLETAYSPPTPPDHSLDRYSPEPGSRLIKPLPKRSLRSRLSPEVADSILYPPAPKISKPVFHQPYNGPAFYDGNIPQGIDIADIDRALIEAQRHTTSNGPNGYEFRGNEDDSEEEDDMGNARRFEASRQASEPLPTRSYLNGAGRPEPSMAHSTVSSNDSVDGYDSFENTNNKKKRKIPTSGSLGSHPSSLSADLANMGLASDGIDGDRMYSDFAENEGFGNDIISTPNGSSPSMSGRGRYGKMNPRNINGRSPLGISANGSNALNIRPGAYRRDYASANKGYQQASDNGIIAASIANGTSLPSPTAPGQENISILQRQTNKKIPPKTTQFTFTCESDSSKDIVWPGDPTQYPDPLLYNQANHPPSHSEPPLFHDQKPVNTTGTQTSPNMPHPGSTQHQQGGQSATGQQQAPTKPRRSPSKRYALAARERRLQQQHNNYYHPPKEEDIWICEFCEYESIFGCKPEALIRQYEIKDRRERKRLAEKRRLLEKAKLKGRKGKKGSKKGAGGGNNNVGSNVTHATQSSTGSQNQQPGSAKSGYSQNQGTQVGDDFLADDYDDDPLDLSDPPPVQVSPPPTKIPQPVGGNPGRKDHASGVGTGPGGGDTEIAI